MTNTPEDATEWDEICRTMLEAQRQSRGYATWWEFAPQRQLEELGAAATLVRFLFGEGAPNGLRFPPKDPPDVVLEIGGRRIGIEVTQIVDPKAVKEARHLKAQRKGWKVEDLGLAHWPWTRWSEQELAARLEEVILDKDGKLAAARASFDEMFLAVVTDEPDIDAKKAARAVAACHAQVASVDRAFLMLGYHPSANKGVYPDGCPIFEVPIGD